MEWQEEVDRGHLEVRKQQRWIDSHSLRIFLVSTRQLLSAWHQHTHLQLCVPVPSPALPLPLSLSRSPSPALPLPHSLSRSSHAASGVRDVQGLTTVICF
jgi:hypothetical protein